MVDLIASVVLAVIFILIMIAFLLAMAWFWGALFMGTPLTYSMLQGNVVEVAHKARCMTASLPFGASATAAAAMPKELQPHLAGLKHCSPRDNVAANSTNTACRLS
jgi:ABC-type multidrug transport system permease subunit